MPNAELGFEAYVFVGNSLNLFLGGMPEQIREQAGLPVTEIVRLDQKLRPVPANEVLRVIQLLDPAEQRLLVECCNFCLRYVGSETETVLGVPPLLAAEIVDGISSPQIAATVAPVR